MLGTAILWAQEVLPVARAHAEAGRHDEAIALLIAHLARNPDDVDARVLLGNVYGWAGRYDEARRALRAVLDARPGYPDAVSSLANVERRAQAATPLAWTVQPSYTYDRFGAGLGSWHEGSLALRRDTRVGAALVRAARAERFGLTDEQLEAEFYPTLGRGRYASLSAALSPDGRLFPDYRVGVDLHQRLPRGFEISMGFRRLAFTEPVNIYVPAVSRYAGNYLFAARVFVTPDGPGTAASLHVSARRYRADGRSYLGVRYGQGSAREELRDIDDVALLDAKTIGADAVWQLTDRLDLTLGTAYAREERVAGNTVRRVTLATGMAIRF
jgi:YaiO family outer membrane protein